MLFSVNDMETKLCIPIVAETVEEALEDLRNAEQYADLVELRLDHIKNISKQGLRELIAARTKPLIVAYRGEKAEKRELLLEAVEAGAEFIDLDESEKNMINDVRKKGKTRIILSFHDFTKTPILEELKQKYKEMEGYHPDFIKIVATATSINDNFKIFEFLKDKKKCIAFCMGIKGVISRILAPKYGSFLTFAALKEKKVSAPGQLTAMEMINVYNVKNINEETEIYGIVGAAAEHSRSPQIHNSFFHETSENARFLSFKVEEKELKKFIDNLQKYHFQGAAITMPHKVAVMQYLDEIDETAAGIGAVNTIVNNHGRFIGYNTDGYGALRALKDKTEVRGKKVLVLGAGGASRAIVYGLRKEGIRVTISNRTLEKAQQLAEEFYTDFLSLADAEKRASEYDIIINATSQGMGLQEGETPLVNLPEKKVVMDIVSYPSITRFIKLAQQNKCTVITGEKMLLYQAVQQYHLWMGKELNSKVLENARQLLRRII